MQRSSPSIASLAAALAKAQQELENPQKSLIGSIRSEGTDVPERLFRYASLASGLEIVRKTLGQHEIATVQTTAVDLTAGIVNLTTMLVHSSSEWIASDWPVCAIADTAEPHRMGAALTYARHYGLFTLVGIAGEDDLDAPDLMTPRPQSSERKGATESGSGRLNGGTASVAKPSQAQKKSPGRCAPVPVLAANASAELRERLLADISGLNDAEAAALWAKRKLPDKNRLCAADAQQVEAAFQARLATMVPVDEVATSSSRARSRRAGKPRAPKTQTINKAVLALPEPRRIRDKDHLRFVAKQPCLICERRPTDPHHLRFAQNRALGRKVSDEFTVPLCRGHHREVHRCGDEAAWWANIGVDPSVTARALWLQTHPLPSTLDRKGIVVEPRPAGAVRGDTVP